MGWVERATNENVKPSAKRASTSFEISWTESAGAACACRVVWTPARGASTAVSAKGAQSAAHRQREDRRVEE